MSANQLRLKFLLQKYINNNCTSAELEEFWLLVSTMPEDDISFGDLEDLWHLKQEQFDGEQNVQWDRIYAHLLQRVEKHRALPVYVFSLTRQRVIKACIAASILLCISFSVWLLYKPVGVNSQMVENKVRSPVHQVIILPDGSSVTLNSDSRLDYPPVFKGSTREVYLTGEAYFDVKHDPDRPFFVHAGPYITKVLGTAFDIKAYPSENNVLITVTRGKVQVQKGKNESSLGILVEGDQLVIDKSTVSGKVKKADIPKVLEWKNKDLDFENITFDEATILISARFGVEFKFTNNTLRNCKFTGRFAYDDKLEEILDIICALTQSTWHKENDKEIRLDGGGCE